MLAATCARWWSPTRCKASSNRLISKGSASGITNGTGGMGGRGFSDDDEDGDAAATELAAAPAPPPLDTEVRLKGEA
jgi:hypothetical protein